MKERGILFSGPMVRAIEYHRKTQTRRVVKHISALGDPEQWCHKIDCEQFKEAVGDYRRFCRYGVPGDRLWVRETWRAHLCSTDDDEQVLYRADSDEKCCRRCGEYYRHWTPAIHMPRRVSRITLEIVSVRVERVNEINYKDCAAEGLSHTERGIWTCPGTNQIFSEGYLAYAWLWESINAKRGFGWKSNPWVWVLEFKRV